MNKWQERTELLIGKDNIKKLSESHVLVAGLGGVGAYAAEQLCRSGIGKMTIADSDTVSKSNINRQILALHSTIGEKKTELAKKRLLDINPSIELTIFDRYITEDTIEDLLETDYDYIVDAIDTLSPKVIFLYRATNKGFKIISSMGAGRKLDPTQVKLVSDFSETHGCHLAFYVRKYLKRLGLKEGFKAVYSAEAPVKESMFANRDSDNKSSTVGVISYLPAIFGLYCASEAIRDLISNE